MRTNHYWICASIFHNGYLIRYHSGNYWYRFQKMDVDLLTAEIQKIIGDKNPGEAVLITSMSLIHTEKIGVIKRIKLMLSKVP